VSASDPWPARHEGDAGLQPHRTELAWRRTSMALFGLALASAKVLEPELGPVALVLAVVAIVLAGALAWGAHQRARRPAAGARLVTTCALVAVLLGLASLVFVVAR
jgi:uncharacterized membrane protein YidH (DUF202 family)